MRDASVFSIQWMTMPAQMVWDISPEWLLQRYYGFLRKVTGGLVRPDGGADGVSFRLAGNRAALIRFLPPRSESLAGEQALSLTVSGGLLVQAGSCDRGVLTFSVVREGGDVRLTLRLTGFRPLLLGNNRPSRLRKLLYRLTQAHIHRMVTVRFLSGICRELAGGKACVRVVKAWVVDGEPI